MEIVLSVQPQEIKLVIVTTSGARPDPCYTTSSSQKGVATKYNKHCCVEVKCLQGCWQVMKFVKQGRTTTNQSKRADEGDAQTRANFTAAEKYTVHSGPTKAIPLHDVSPLTLQNVNLPAHSSKARKVMWRVDVLH